MTEDGAREREVDVSHARSGGLTRRCARSSATRAPREPSESVDARFVWGAKRAFFLGSPSRRRTSRETTRASRTPPFFSCATTSGVTRSTATPRSDLILPRSNATSTRRARLEVTEAGEGGASQSENILLSLVPHHLTRSRFFEGSDVSSKRALRACVTTIRARQLGSPWRPARVHARGVCSARSAQRALPCPRFVPACCAGGPPEISRAPQRPDESFVWFETSRAPASRRVFHV